MTTDQDRFSAIMAQLDEFTDRLDRHQRVVDGIKDNPDDYDADAVDAYLNTLEEHLKKSDFLEGVEASLEPLEQATEQAKEATLQGARILIDDQEIDGTELQYLHDAADQMEASLLVESPKVNQLRGGRPRIELPDGREYGFTIEQTLVAEVKDDNSGFLELVLALNAI